VIAARKAGRAMRTALPLWLIAVFTACLVIPGPFDELAMIVVTGALCAVQPVRARRAASAWRGGKSHRAHDGA
jgi:hypothetical protein